MWVKTVEILPHINKTEQTKWAHSFISSLIQGFEINAMLKTMSKFKGSSKEINYFWEFKKSFSR